ncbi:DEAD/DEAH box helicase [Streptococcus cameli]
MKDYKDYAGCWFTKYQLSEEERAAALLVESDNMESCLRCASPYQAENQLPNGAYYCRECILLGRVRSDESLYYFPQLAFPKESVLKWQGQLTRWQKQVSEGLCQAVDVKQSTLVHAVTGAGKTEMMYAVVAKVIAEGGAVCIASPRIDVCIELHKRLSTDFICPAALLHGESEGYFRTPLVVATTHQLLKFYQAFDLLIIDEVDAFPYVDNPMLYCAAQNSRKKEGVVVYLTATSTDALDKKIKSGELKKLSLPRRFHGNPLVVPRKIWVGRFNKQIAKGQLPSIIYKQIKLQRNTDWPLLIFAPEIELGVKIASILQNYFPEEEIGFVSSQTENRLEIVEKFRAQEITILVSTTILERGVTFPGVDVLVLQAEHRLYTSSSLIQIAGRAGRSMERPTGIVQFFSEGSTSAIEKAIAEIKKMNQEAGYE